MAWNVVNIKSSNDCDQRYWPYGRGALTDWHCKLTLEPCKERLCKRRADKRLAKEHTHIVKG